MYMGVLPTWSRVAKNEPSVRSYTTRENMPRKYLGKSMPWAWYKGITTSQSDPVKGAYGTANEAYKSL